MSLKISVNVSNNCDEPGIRIGNIDGLLFLVVIDKDSSFENGEILAASSTLSSQYYKCLVFFSVWITS